MTPNARSDDVLGSTDSDILAAYREVARGLRNVLALADAAADAGDLADAAELVSGAMTDLSPPLALLRASRP